MFDLPENSICFSDSAYGIYIPQYFAEAVDRDRVENISDEQYEILLEGPDSEFYWDVWVEVEESAVITDSNGQKFSLYQDGDLWLVPLEADW